MMLFDPKASLLEVLKNQSDDDTRFNYLSSHITDVKSLSPAAFVDAINMFSCKDRYSIESKAFQFIDTFGETLIPSIFFEPGKDPESIISISESESELFNCFRHADHLENLHKIFETARSEENHSKSFRND